MDTKKKRRVVITGLGTVNPTGNTVAESWANIKAGRCAVGPITAFDTADFKVKLAAEVKDFDPAARIDKREARKMARFTQFAVAAADEAVRDSGLALEEIDHTRFGVILSSGIGGLRDHLLLRDKCDELDDTRFHQQELYDEWEKLAEEQETFENEGE